MPKIKEVPSAEVHWQVTNINVNAANSRVKTFMGPDSIYFAPVYVTPAGYYWSDPDPEGWMPLTIASAAEQSEANSLIEEIRQRAIRRSPNAESRISQMLSVPNEDYIMIRNTGNGLELRLTGWGFANFNRARTVRISDMIEETKINDVTVSFSTDGQIIPNRVFYFARGVDWAEATTDKDGYYNFGTATPGTQVTVRDKLTGKEKIEVVTPDTTNIDVDVTEWLRVRVIARHDNVPISGEQATGTYGHRTMTFDLIEGAATQTLPWLDGQECTITFRGQSQKRELRKDAVNEFVFDSKTPRIPHTVVKVVVTNHGEPVPGESVKLTTPQGTFSLVTGPEGVANHEYEMTSEGNITAEVRDKSASKAAVDGEVVIPIELDVALPVEFDCYLRTVNQEDMPMALYPVDIKLGSDAPVSCMTDENGLIGPIHVLSGGTMTAYDGNDPEHNETFDLVADQQEYIFKLPYSSTPNLGDVSLRVMLLNNRPAAGITCILTQDNKRITAMLDNNGYMTFGSDDFDMNRPLTVNLYSPSREFPELSLPLDPNEKEYELVEVTGPQPWWQIAGEIVLALGGLLTAVGIYFLLEGLYSRIPYLFG